MMTSRPLRLLYRVHHFCPECRTGMEKFVLQLARCMRSRSHEVQVAAYRVGGLRRFGAEFWQRWYTYAGVPVFSLRHRRRPTDYRREVECMGNFDLYVPRITTLARRSIRRTRAIAFVHTDFCLAWRERGLASIPAPLLTAESPCTWHSGHPWRQRSLFPKPYLAIVPGPALREAACLRDGAELMPRAAAIMAALHLVQGLAARISEFLGSWPDAGILSRSDDGAPDPLRSYAKSQNVRQACRRRYGSRAVRLEPSSLDRGQIEAVQNAAIDLWLRRGTDVFVGTIACIAAHAIALCLPTEVAVDQNIMWRPPQTREVS
jgi:hypothetical protein